jgi:pimeloyl-ACP methyl ester carboxylesterase
VRRLALLDPAIEVPIEAALQSAEVERLDWSFATIDGGVNALLSSGRMVAAPRDVVTAFARDDLSKGPDGRLRFSFSPAAVVVAWSEICLPAPPIAQVPTLVIRPEVPLFPAPVQAPRYRESLGELLTEATVPNGHNVLWEAPEETISAIENFVGVAA